MPYTQQQIQEIILKEGSVRVQFIDDRSAMFGKLVLLNDGGHLLNKGFVRFVKNDELDYFEGTHPEQMYGDKSNLVRNDSLTKIYAISSFLKIYEYGN